MPSFSPEPASPSADEPDDSDSPLSSDDDVATERGDATRRGSASDGDDDEEAEALAASRTVGDIVSKIHKRGRAKPMPSTVRRNEERRRKRARKERGEDVESEETGTRTGDRGGAPSNGTGGVTESAAPATALAPQVRLDDDGNIVIDHASLMVESGAAGGGQQLQTVVESADQRAHITSASFVKRQKSTRWRDEEIEYFYTCLTAFGTDFSLMEKAFRTRNRKQLKLRYKKEEKSDPDRIDAALAKPAPLDLAERLLANPQADDPLVIAINAAVATANNAEAAGGDAAVPRAADVVASDNADSPTSPDAEND